MWHRASEELTNPHQPNDSVRAHTDVGLPATFHPHPSRSRVHSGVPHSKGAVHELHRVSYSIGLVGRYHLHVRLRQAALPVPGSPFTLIVKPGKASATSTRIPAGISQMHPLRGKVTILWVASEQCVQCSSP